MLQNKSIPFEEISLEDNDELREQLSSKHGWRTVPMIMIGEKFIGGYDQLAELERSQKLDAMLK